MHNDMYIYRKYYGQFNFLNYTYSEMLNWEIGYKFSNVLLNRYLEFYDYKLLYYFCSIFLIYLGIKNIRIRNNVLVVTLLILNFQFTSTYISALRQVMAISIVIYSIPYLYQRRKKEYLFLILIASLFHRSALILVFLILIEYIKKRILLLFLIAKISIFFKNKIVNFINFIMQNFVIFSRFKDNEIFLKHDINLFSFTNDLPTIIIIFYFYFYKPSLLKKNKNLFILKGYLIYYFIVNMGYYFSFAYRLKPYLIIFYIFAIVTIIGQESDVYKRKLSEVIMVVFFIIFYFLFQISSENKRGGTWIPYTNYFQNIIREISYKDTVEYKTSSSHRKKNFKIKNK